MSAVTFSPSYSISLRLPCDASRAQRARGEIDSILHSLDDGAVIWFYNRDGYTRLHLHVALV
jgi:hypothetical protein